MVTEEHPKEKKKAVQRVKRQKWFQRECRLGNFLDNILIINSCYKDDKTIMTRKRHTLFSDGVLPWQSVIKSYLHRAALAPEGRVKVFHAKKHNIQGSF